MCNHAALQITGAASDHEEDYSLLITTVTWVAMHVRFAPVLCELFALVWIAQLVRRCPAAVSYIILRKYAKGDQWAPEHSRLRKADRHRLPEILQDAIHRSNTSLRAFRVSITHAAAGLHSSLHIS